MSTPFDFNTQLKLGDEGEVIFDKLYGHFFDKNNSTDVMLPDFKHKQTGALAEIKYDNSPKAAKDKNGYQLNFFIELFSNSKTLSLGGPFRAAVEGVDYYVYMFKEPFRIFLMDAVKLRDIAAEVIDSKKYRQIPIKNKGWWTQGYALPIALFKECFIEGDVLREGKILNDISATGTYLNIS